MATKPAPVTEAVIEATRDASTLIPQATLDRIELTVKELKVESDFELEQANEFLHFIEESSVKWEKHWVPLIKLANDTHKGLLATARPLREKFKAYRDGIEEKMSAYVKQKGQERQEAQKAIDDVADAARQERLREADMLAKRGFMKEATEARATVDMIPTPSIPVEKPVLTGTTTRKTWVVEVTDLKAFVLAVADGQAPIEAIKVDLAFLRKEARQREGLPWPGVSAHQKLGFSVRS